jgi:hypothetical protein
LVDQKREEGSLLFLFLLLLGTVPDVGVVFGLLVLGVRCFVDICVGSELLLRESMVVVFWGSFLSILVEVLMVNLFSIFLLDSTTLFFSWNSLASRKAVARASFFMFYTRLFLHPSIVVYDVAEPIPIYFPR